MIVSTKEYEDALLPPRSEVRVACILDEFSYAGFAPEAEFLQLSPSEWRLELESFRPSLLFVESAWRGKDNLWRNTVSRVGPEISGIVEWCKARDIPTVFWNKEDPVHFSTFLALAKLFDIVLTTDMDSVPRYKQILRKEKVYFFPFAAQTRIHNPLEIFERQDAFCFAGSYYARYPERTAALESFTETLSTVKPFVIFDRNFGGGPMVHEDYVFPQQYSRFILGRLDPAEIDLAYKGFDIGVNLNSVRSSQSMLARRVYELIASNTLIVSNFSPALRTLFGKLVLFSERGEVLLRQLESLSQIPEGLERVRAQALRKVLREHTYQDRFAFICEKAGLHPGYVEPSVTAISFVKEQTEIDRVIATVREQSTVPDDMVFVVESMGIWKAAGKTKLLTHDEAKTMELSKLAEGRENHYVAVIDPSHSYGSRYLEDLLLATKYSSTDFVLKFGAPRHTAEDVPYTLAEGFEPRQGILRSSSFTNMDVFALLGSTTSRESVLDRATGIVIDGFEYSGDGRDAVPAEIIDEGYPLDELVNAASLVAPTRNDGTKKLDLAALAAGLSKQEPKLRAAFQGDQLVVASDLDEGVHRYIYSSSPVPVNSLGWEAGSPANVYVEVSPGLDLMLVVLFLDESGKRLGHTMARPNGNHSFKIPEGTTQINIGLRASGPGSADILNIHQEEYTLPSVGVKEKSPYVVLTNIYPSYDNLYRNGFVHSRVKAYQENGLEVAVVCLTDSPIPRFREFEGVLIYEIDRRALANLLVINDVRAVLVHFLDEEMWEVVGNPNLGIPVHVWVHGSEVQPWWRRSYNAVTDSELADAKEKSAVRMQFWEGVFNRLPDHVDFVFVSKYFAEEVMEDVGIRLPEDRYRIIHNPIDSAVFNFVPKSQEQRLRILSIRPYASRKYANDLSVAAVLDLAKEDYFSEFEFLFVGDGPLFEETLAPLNEFPNVRIERRFLTHQEIADYHKEYGVLMTPTRMDAQGVSRDEGMSSGLVPLTTAVAAVPEFVDEKSGFLAPLDSYRELADGIRTLYHNPELFQRMSQAASERVANQSEKKIVVSQELHLITGEVDMEKRERRSQVVAGA